MSAVTYTAKRSIVAGHTEDNSYTIDLRLVSLDGAPDVQKSEQRALGGRRETLLFRSGRAFQASTAAVRLGERDLVREFLDSVIGGELFQFDEFGHAGSPHNPQNAIMPGTYREQRAVRQGDGGQQDYFRYSFAIELT